MATKPQSYPEKIQALNAQLAERDEELNKLRHTLQEYAGVTKERDEFKTALEELKSIDQANVGTNKAAFTDMQQRAESAEQALRKLQTINEQYQKHLEAVDSQIDLLGKEQLKAQQLERNNNLLAEELKQVNVRLVNAQTRMTEVAREKDAEIEQLRKNYTGLSNAHQKLGEQVNELQINAEQKVIDLKKQVQELTDALRVANDNRVAMLALLGQHQKVLKNIRTALNGGV